MLKAIAFLLLTMTILGCLLGVMQYQVTYESRENYRELIDLIENILNHECLVYEENGNIWRGVFDKGKLNANPFCQISYPKNFYVEIIDSENTWVIGNKPLMSKLEESLSYPVLIKYSNKLAVGRMEVGTYS